MNSDRAQQAILLLWLGAAGLQVANQVISASNPQTDQQGNAITKGSQKTIDYLVPPHKLMASAVVYTGLFFVAEFAPALAVALAAGVDLLVLLGPIVATGATGNPATDTSLFGRLSTLIKAEA